MLDYGWLLFTYKGDDMKMFASSGVGNLLYFLLTTLNANILSYSKRIEEVFVVSSDLNNRLMVKSYTGVLNAFKSSSRVLHQTLKHQSFYGKSRKRNVSHTTAVSNSKRSSHIKVGRRNGGR